VLARILIGVVRLYQLAVSPWTPGACRYTPTCSAYAIGALEEHGPLRGSWLALRRLARCHPWGGYGYDRVPPTNASRSDRHRVVAHGAGPEGDADDPDIDRSGVHRSRVMPPDARRSDEEEDRGDRMDDTARTDRVMAG
jgi:putative membrane protein insertion efficiency factor